MKYRPALDGLRAVSVALVVVFHSTYGSRWQLPGGFLGVDVFFVISGALITGLLIAEWQSTSALRLRGFYLRRVLRLGPALLITLIAVVLIQHFVGPAGTQPLWQPIIATMAYVANWWQIAAPSATTYLDHTWSLAIEEQFYLVWPITLLVLLRRGHAPRHVAAIAAIGCGLAATTRWQWHDAWPPSGVFGYKVLYENTVTRADSLLAGIVVGCLVSDPLVRHALNRTRERFTGRPRALVIVREVTPWLAAAEVAALIAHANNDSPWLYRFGFTLVALLSATVVAHCLLVDRSLFVRVLASAPFRRMGQISYGIYLFHLPIALALVDHSSLGPLLRLLVVSTTSVAAAAVSYTLVERRAQAFGRRRSRRVTAPVAAEVAVIPAEST